MNLILLAGLFVIGVYTLPVKHDSGKPPINHNPGKGGENLIENLKGNDRMKKLNKIFHNLNTEGIERIEGKMKKLKGIFEEKEKSRRKNLRKTSKTSDLLFGFSNKKDEIPDITDLIDPDLEPFLIEGDIKLTEAQIDRLLEETENPTRSKRQASVTDNKWTTVSYYFDDAAGYTDDQKDLMRAGFNFWRDNTCIQFEESETADNRIRVAKIDGCYADLGMNGGEQEMSLDDDCLLIGIASHEMAHALGVWHQQSRSDREDHVTVYDNRIKTGEGSQYAIKSNADNYGVPYDYGSVMHYKEDSFITLNANGPVMEADEPLHQKTMGQRDGPSFNDLLLINKHYDCLGICTDDLGCQNGGYPNPADCSRCICPGGFAGILCDKRPSSTNAEFCVSSSIDATTSWQTFNGSLNRENIAGLSSESCTHWIKSPEGTQIELEFVQMSKKNYSCRTQSLEVKGAQEMTMSGYRICPIGTGTVSLSNIPVITTLGNKAILILRNSRGTFGFQVRYRYIESNNNGDCADKFPECEGYAASGDCEWDLPYMKDYCSHSCNFC